MRCAVMVLSQRVQPGSREAMWARHFGVHVYYPDRSEPDEVWGTDSEAVATDVLRRHPGCKVLFKTRDNYDFLLRAARGARDRGQARVRRAALEHGDRERVPRQRVRAQGPRELAPGASASQHGWGRR
jgi:hypothetical protein